MKQFAFLATTALILALFGCGENTGTPKTTPPVDDKLQNFIRQLPVGVIDIDNIDIESMWLFQIQEKITGKPCYALIEIVEITKSNSGFIICGKSISTIGREMYFKIRAENNAVTELPARDYVNYLHVAFNNTAVLGLGLVRTDSEIVGGDGDDTNAEIQENIRAGIFVVGNLVKIESTK